MKMGTFVKGTYRHGSLINEIAKQISDNIVTHISNIPNIVLSQTNINTVIKLVPVIYFVAKDINCFLNLHEFVYTPGALECLLLDPKVTGIEGENDEDDQRQDKPDDEKKVNRKGIGGQPSLVSKFPGIIDEAAEFIK